MVADCAYSRTGEGLHRFSDPVDGRVYLYTQFEPADARRLYANFEQPDLKASFTFDVKAPAGWYISSNSAPAKREPVVDGVAHWRFLPTLRISTYITVVVAGPYHVASDHYSRDLGDGTTLEIPLNALCRGSLSEYFDADAIFDVTKRGLDFFHDKFDYAYPFGKYDQAFVPEYNLGAMENPGCVTFTEDFVFRSKQTDSAYESRANVILHEMAHMWFGDLVTMKWWDDLWLKESFADFMGSYASVGATRWTNAWVTFANLRKAWAYRQDQLPSTHPIVATINDLEDAKLNFDGITYAKGASVLKQLVAYVGEEAFLEGARRYFKRHAYGNTTLSDLLRVLEETSGRDLSAWSKAWLETSGVNTLTIAHDGTARQEGHLRPHRIAVGAYELKLDERLVVRTQRVEIDLAEESTTLPAEVRDAPFVLINDDDLSYCKVTLDDAQLAYLAEHLSTFNDPMSRSLLWSALWNMTRDGVLPATEYIAFVDRHAPAESEIGVLSNLLNQTTFVLGYYLDEQNRAAALEPVAAMAERELHAAARPARTTSWPGCASTRQVGRAAAGPRVADRPARRLGHPRRPDRGRRPALGVRAGPSLRGRGRPGDDRRRAGARPHRLRPPQPRRRPGRTPAAGGQGRGLARRDGPPRPAEGRAPRPARRLRQARPERADRPLRRAVLRRARPHLGRAHHRERLHDRHPRLPQLPGRRGHPRAGRRLAGRPARPRPAPPGTGGARRPGQGPAGARGRGVGRRVAPAVAGPLRPGAEPASAPGLPSPPVFTEPWWHPYRQTLMS